MMENNTLGAWGERTALRYLRKKGYKFVESNYHSRFGEIDIIVKNREYIVFVEVKLRKNDKYGEAKEFVTFSKQNKIRSTAMIWLSGNETELQPRFDVIEIYAPDGEHTASPSINHLEDAF